MRFGGDLTKERVYSGRLKESYIEHIVYTRGSIEAIVIGAKNLKNYKFSVAVVKRAVRSLGLNIL